MLDLNLDPGALALLQQGYRNNWQRYLASLDGSGAVRPAWDLCVLTAANAPQAEAFEAQLDARRHAGLLPSQTRFLVLADPQGLRPGSGGATLHVLAELARLGLLSARRILLLHSGGDSRRLPHCSALGKLFARVPHELPDGRPSSLFDEFLVSLSGLPAQIPEGLLVASGDVLLLFDHLQLAFARPGVIGVAAAAPAETGTHHGVYVTADSARLVSSFLHKPSLARLRSAGALQGDGHVQIDTGLVWFDPSTMHKMLLLAQQLAPALAQGVTLNLYGDLLAPLAQAADQAAYLSDTSDGPATPALRDARRLIWETLRGTPFSVERLSPAAFIHFGTTAEYLDLLRLGVRLFSSCGWRSQTASWLGSSLSSDAGRPLVAVNACLQDGLPSAACLLDSSVEAHLELGEGSLLAQVVTERPSLALKPGLVLDQLPLRASWGYVTRLLGVSDDPKRSLAAGGTFLNLPWPAWLEAARLSPADLWPAALHHSACTLWEARLYPPCATREDSLDLALWMQSPDSAPAALLGRWRASPRLSLAQSYLLADVRQLVREQAVVEDRVRARRFYAGLERQQPAATLAPLLGGPQDAPRRARLVADWLEASIDPWLPMRGYRALAVATGDRRWDDRAFSTLARLVRAHIPLERQQLAGLPMDRQRLAGLPDRHQPERQQLAGPSPDRQQHGCSTLHPPAGLPMDRQQLAGPSPERQQLAGISRPTIRAAARLDFGGGWTDTPPYSLERGGTVLNAAITLRGALPIVAQVERLAEPLLELHCQDIEATLRPRLAAEVLNYANPADPFALHKAALVFTGLVPADSPPERELAELFRGAGLRLVTSTSIPRGSGLGTSSILAGALLKALADYLGNPLDQSRLFDQVLCLEQMITTGGGWQDQVGGLTGGIKLITTAPGLPQVAHIEPVPLTPSLKRALDERLLLIYTGQRRLAKDLLRAMMGRYMARDPEMLSMLGDIASLARQMHRALLAADLDAFGALVAQHWEINKRMDPGCTNPFIDDLLALCQPYLCGAKLAGAGGGGFALALARDAAAAQALRSALAIRHPQSEVRLWPCAVAQTAVQ